MQLLEHVMQGKSLSREQMTAVMNTIMTGGADDAFIAAMLTALRMKGETIDEITAAADVMRSLSTKVELSVSPLVDIVGTGGDGASTFNISTAACFVVAASGAYVAKHGNRSVSSSSGSADVLEAAGVNLALSAEQVAACVENVGVGFMFAPNHHSAMKHAIGARKSMKVRTLFNLLGPLTNPAGATNMVLGVFDKKWVEPMAHALNNLGANHVMVVASEDGLDEISIAASTFVAELKEGSVSTFMIQPEDFGLTQAEDLSELKVVSAQESLAVIQEIFEGAPGAATDIVVLNAGAAIYVAGQAVSLQAGVEKAQALIASGAAKEKLSQLIKQSRVG